MEFDEVEHDDQEEEIGNIHQLSSSSPPATAAGLTGNYQMGNNSEGVISVRKSGVRYRECLKNHAVGIGGHAVDGCGEFLPAGEEGSMDALKCAACNCHRNFHRKETEGENFHPTPHFTHYPQLPYRTTHHHHHHPSGYLHVNPPPRPLALPSTSREDEDMSNPSSSGGAGSGGVGGSRKRFRTRFTQEQKDKMLGFAESLGWRMQKQDEAAVQQFCAETNVRRHVFKVWMHNNKHTLGKKP